LVLFSLAAVAIRHYFNIRHLAGFQAWPLIPAALLLSGLIFVTAPGSRPAVKATGEAAVVTTGEVFNIVQQRCVKCHSPEPDFAGFTSAPLGIELDSEDKLVQHADRVYQTVVVMRSMPLANLTKMSNEERDLVANWFSHRESNPVE
jgi:uncharacterized membrane protein